MAQPSARAVGPAACSPTRLTACTQGLRPARRGERYFRGAPVEPLRVPRSLAQHDLSPLWALQQRLHHRFRRRRSRRPSGCSPRTPERQNPLCAWRFRRAGQTFGIRASANSGRRPSQPGRVLLCSVWVETLGVATPASGLACSPGQRAHPTSAPKLLLARGLRPAEWTACQVPLLREPSTGHRYVSAATRAAAA